MNRLLTPEPPEIHDEPPWPGARAGCTVNALVADLPGQFTGLQPVTLQAGEVLHAPNQPIRHVYFPLGCLISLFTDKALRRDVALEVALIGREGMVGVCLAFGNRTASTSALVQTSGPALRATADDFRRALLQTTGLQRRALRYGSDLASLFSQSAACSRNHSTRQRLARWLVMAHVRLGDTEIRLTQQAIARTLSTRRTGVNAAAVELKRRGLIRYRRGVMEILDVAGLREVSCPCLERPGAPRTAP